MPSIYPTYNLPKLTPVGTTTEQEDYTPSFYFDYETGDFVRDGANRPTKGTGREAYEQWCLKQCVTERYTKLGYSDNIGVELVEALKEDGILAVESAITKTITEALMVNPATEYVRHFKFSWDGSDHLQVTFRVKGRPWVDDSELSVTY